jgi:hypothetical protein
MNSQYKEIVKEPKEVGTSVPQKAHLLYKICIYLEIMLLLA